MKLKHAILSLAICLGVTGMQAQEKNYEPYPYVFVGVQGGGQMTLTNYDHMKLFTPLAGVNFGAMFSPVVGLRLGAQGIWNKTAAKAAFGPYNKADFKYVTGDLDLLVNLSNAIFPGKTHTFNTFLVVGAGLAYAWDFKPEDGMTATTLKEFEWQRDRLTHNIRVGLAEEVNICKNLAVNLEVDLNNLHDRFNAKRNWNNDWQLTAMLGLNFKFGFKKREVPAPEPAPEPAPVVVEPKPVAPVAPPVANTVVKKPEVKPEPKPAPFVPEKNQLDIFFNLAKANVNADAEKQIRDMGEWLKARPNSKVTVTGYADKGTGNAKTNERLSKQRAEAVKKELVEKFGYDADQITLDYKGDTVQPYAENDKNRMVRVEAITFEKK